MAEAQYLTVASRRLHAGMLHAQFLWRCGHAQSAMQLLQSAFEGASAVFQSGSRDPAHSGRREALLQDLEAARSMIAWLVAQPQLPVQAAIALARSGALAGGTRRSVACSVLPPH